MRWITGVLLAGLCMVSRAEPVTDVTLNNGEWPPYQSESAPGYGPASQVVREAFALEGIRVHFRFRPWKRAYAEASDGTVQGTFSWSRTPAREKAFFYSDPLFRGRSVFFHLAERHFSWKSLDDLVPERIGGTLGYRYLFERDSRLSVIRAPSDVEGFRMLLAGRFDLFPSDLYAGLATIHQAVGAEQAESFAYASRPYQLTDYHLLLSRQDPNSPQLLQRFNAGLAKLHASGRYSALFDEQSIERQARSSLSLAP